MRAIPLLLLAACLSCAGSEDPTLARGVQHLDPRLEDGRSAAEALATERRVVQEVDLTAGLPEDWGLVNGVDGGPGPRGGRAIALVPDAPGPIGLILPGEHPTHLVNVLELDLAVASQARVDLRWKTSAGAGGLVSAVSAGTGAVETVVLPLLDDPAWIGTARNLFLSPSANKPQGVELLAARLVFDPLVPGVSPDPAQGDVGLVTLDGEGRRAWPMELDQAVSATVTVPAGGRLELALARAPGTPPEELGLAVTLTADGAAEELGTRPLPADAGGWVPAAFDLAAHAGREVTLTFTATGGQPSPSPRARVLLGTPLVRGDLVADRRPNVLLVTLDTLRFDALGANQDAALRLGYTVSDPALVHTPFLDALAARSYLFEEAWSAANSTQPSHASILTGAPVQDHSLFDNFGSLAPANRTLAEELRAAGYETAAVVCQGAISIPAGFGQGFDRFVPASATSITDGRLALDVATAWLREWEAAGEGPFFLWVHLFDPHTPYLLPDGFVEGFAETVGVSLPDPDTAAPLFPPVKVLPPELAFLEGVRSEAYADYLYHVEVTYTDALMGELLAALEPHAADTLVALTSDHGEFLGEGGSYYNHRGLEAETLHVPLFLSLPGQTEGRVVTDRVTSRDVTPTVVSLLGLAEVPEHRDLVAVADRGTARADRRLWFEHANGMQVGFRDERWHFVTTLRSGVELGTRVQATPAGPVVRPVTSEAGDVFLYDWTVDPGLERNLADELPRVVGECLAEVEAYRAAARPVGRVARAVGDDEAAELEALGYTGD